MTRFTPGVVAFYRGKAGHSSAIQLKLIAPTPEQAGYVIIDMTNGPKPFTFDWKNKLSFKLSYQEVAAIANFHGKPLTFKHDPNAKREGAGTITKTFEIKPGNQGGVFVDLVTYKGGAKDKAHAISLNDDEFFAIRRLCDRALTIMPGWEPEYLGMLQAATANRQPGSRAMPQTATPKPAATPPLSVTRTPPRPQPPARPAQAGRPTVPPPI